MSYGFCPHCGAEVTSRTRGMPGNDTCRGGHVYPSRLTLSYRPVATTEVLREAGQLLAAFEEALRTDEVLAALAGAKSAFAREVAALPFLGRVRATRGLIDRHLTEQAAAAGRVA